jgi:DNA-binding NtrC family response regulator
MKEAKVLIIEDDPDGLRSVSDAVRDAGIDVFTAATGESGLALFREQRVDAVLSDLVLPDIDGIEILTRIKKLQPEIPVIIMTAYGSIDSSVKALKAGAYDYISKPLDLDDLQSKISRAIETANLRHEVVALRKTLHERYSSSAIVAESPNMKHLMSQVEMLANTNATALISGESGTGKELVAKALHYDGQRTDGPFVAVNCGAFAEALLESELFGHEKGSFTGAIGRHKGAFERAHGGTLFLDEIGDAPKSVQVKLLRALEEREIIRIGGQESFKVDVRLISASNRSLEDLVETGEFREDLLYRLKVVNLEIPPLRDRREDIRPLVDRFVASAVSEHGRHIVEVEKEYYEALEQHDWPGNVRELRNIVEASVVMASEPVLKSSAAELSAVRKMGQSDVAIPLNMTLEELEKAAITQQLKKFQGNRTLTADALGLSRRTVQRKIKDHNLPF